MQIDYFRKVIFSVLNLCELWLSQQKGLVMQAYGLLRNGIERGGIPILRDDLTEEHLYVVFFRSNRLSARKNKRTQPVERLFKILLQMWESRTCSYSS